MPVPRAWDDMPGEQFMRMIVVAGMTRLAEIAAENDRPDQPEVDESPAHAGPEAGAPATETHAIGWPESEAPDTETIRRRRR